jgi:peptidoglycan/xylan/chitin deacetylase (PgdA/CDA1 family)
MKLPNTVINFHVIQNTKWMDDILKMLTSHYKMVSVEQLENYYFNGLDLQNACHITVDDGDVSVYTHLFPLIKKYKIPISIYISPYVVISGKNFWFQEMMEYDLRLFLEYYNRLFGTKHIFINKYQVFGLIKSLPLKEIQTLIEGFKKENKIKDKPRRCLDVNQLLELHESGLVAIGAHTINHPILRNESYETVKDEVLRSVIELEKLLNSKVKYFAYPNGFPGIDFGEREMRILEECNIRLAFSTQSKNFSNLDHPLSVPRRGITKGGPIFVLTKLALGDYWDSLKRILKGKQEPDFRVR